MTLAGLITDNPFVKYGLLILIALGLYKGKEKADRIIGARKNQREMEARARKVQVKLQRENDEKSAQVDVARKSVPRDIDHSDRVPDSLSSVIFGD